MITPRTPARRGASDSQLSFESSVQSSVSSSASSVTDSIQTTGDDHDVSIPAGQAVLQTLGSTSGSRGRGGAQDDSDESELCDVCLSKTGEVLRHSKAGCPLAVPSTPRSSLKRVGPRTLGGKRPAGALAEEGSQSDDVESTPSKRPRARGTKGASGSSKTSLFADPPPPANLFSDAVKSPVSTDKADLLDIRRNLDDFCGFFQVAFDSVSATQSTADPNHDRNRRRAYDSVIELIRAHGKHRCEGTCKRGADNCICIGNSVSGRSDSDSSVSSAGDDVVVVDLSPAGVRPPKGGKCDGSDSSKRPAQSSEVDMETQSTSSGRDPGNAAGNASRKASRGRAGPAPGPKSLQVEIRFTAVEQGVSAADLLKAKPGIFVDMVGVPIKRELKGKKLSPEEFTPIHKGKVVLGRIPEGDAAEKIRSEIVRGGGQWRTTSMSYKIQFKLKSPKTWVISDFPSEKLKLTEYQIGRTIADSNDFDVMRVVKLKGGKVKFSSYTEVPSTIRLGKHAKNLFQVTAVSREARECYFCHAMTTTHIAGNCPEKQRASVRGAHNPNNQQKHPNTFRPRHDRGTRRPNSFGAHNGPHNPNAFGANNPDFFYRPNHGPHPPLNNAHNIWELRQLQQMLGVLGERVASLCGSGGRNGGFPPGRHF